jgi:undecaprenyl-diphosphatase
VDKGVPEVVAEKLPPIERYGLRVVLFAVAVSLVGVPFGLLLEQVVTKGPLTEADTGVAEWLHERVAGSHVAIEALKVISLIGKPITLGVLIGIVVIWLLRNGARKLVVFLIATSLGGGIVDSVVKIVVGRPRPELDHPVTHAFGKSFPSGHAMSSTICFGALFLVLAPVLSPGRRRVALGLAIVLPLAIGISRLALGVHFVSDVLGGWVLGMAWLAASVAAFEIWREDRGRRTTAPLEEGVEPEEGRKLVDQPV